MLLSNSSVKLLRTCQVDPDMVTWDAYEGQRIGNDTILKILKPVKPFCSEDFEIPKVRVVDEWIVNHHTDQHWFLPYHKVKKPIVHTIMRSASRDGRSHFALHA